MARYSFIAFSLIFFLFMESSGCSDSSSDPYPQIDLPIFAGAIQKKDFIDFNKSIKSVSYKLKIKYPADQVVNFYKAKLKKNGFTLKESGEPKWENFIDDTLEGSPKIRQLLSSWENNKLQVEAFLALIYRNSGKGWSDELNVTCQLQPAVDISEIEKFMEELKTAGDDKYSDFMKLLDLYRGENGQVDMEKAVNENKDNAYLRRYKDIVDRVKRELERK